MDNMLKQLMQKSVDASVKVDSVNLTQLIQDVIDKKCNAIKPAPHFSKKADVELDLNADKLSNVLYNLISNAQQACDQNGLVDIKVSEQDDLVYIDIIDNGSGMTSEFITNELFTPFVTTKGNAGMGVGAYDAKTYLESIGGSLIVQSEVGKGSWFRLALPNNKESE